MYDFTANGIYSSAGQVSSLCAGCRGLWCDSAYSECHDQKLEEELDVKIFSRDRKNISPTAIGEKIIRQARIALNETQRIREVVADESSSMNGSLRIGILPTIAPYLVPDFIYHFRNTYPNVNLSIDEKENKSLVQDLRFGNLDIAITTPPEAQANILEIPVYVEKFVAYFSERCSKSTADNRKRQSATGTHVDSERGTLPSQQWHKFL